MRKKLKAMSKKLNLTFMIALYVSVSLVDLYEGDVRSFFSWPSFFLLAMARPY